jgi:uncharacterized Zn-binding protein involved in type VI secretion
LINRLTFVNARQFFTTSLREDGYAGEVTISGVSSIHIGDLNMLKPQKNETTYLFVTLGSHTKLGGRVTQVTTKAEYEGKALARVGDIVTYDDGSEATIIDGAGFAAAWDDKPFALVGSRLSNRDTITETLQDGWGITVRDGETIPGLFDPAYALPPIATTDGGSNHA